MFLLSNNQRGDISIFIAITALIFLLVIGVTIYVLIFSQLNMSTQEGQSIKAFYAADAGAETCLYLAFKGGPSDPCYDTTTGPVVPGTAFGNGATFEAWRVSSSTAGSSIHSVGRFQNTSRKVELTWE